MRKHFRLCIFSFFLRIHVLCPSRSTAKLFVEINFDGNYRDCGAVDVSQVFTEDAPLNITSCQSTGNFPYLTYHSICVFAVSYGTS